MQNKVNGLKRETVDVTMVHQFWTAAFIDLLGQKEMLKKIDYVPKDDDSENKDEFIQNVHNTYGRLKFVTDYIRNISATLCKSKPITKYPKGQMQKWETMHSPKVGIQRFSDGALVYFPMRDYTNYSVPVGINNILLLAGMLMLGTLAKEIPIRIGIAIGAGALIDGMLYGPVVACAYELENQVARFPRAVISDRIRLFLYEIAKIPPKNDKESFDPKESFDQKIAERCLNFIEQDADKNWYVDYLSRGFIDGDAAKIESASALNMMIERACHFVHTEHKNFTNENNKKLTERYESLSRYFDDYLTRTKEGQ